MPSKLAVFVQPTVMCYSCCALGFCPKTYNTPRIFLLPDTQWFFTIMCYCPCSDQTAYQLLLARLEPLHYLLLIKVDNLVHCEVGTTRYSSWACVTLAGAWAQVLSTILRPFYCRWLSTAWFPRRVRLAWWLTLLLGWYVGTPAFGLSLGFIHMGPCPQFLNFQRTKRNQLMFTPFYVTIMWPILTCVNHYLINNMIF